MILPQDSGHPTESHALAAATPEMRGAAQVPIAPVDSREEIVQDLGWTEREKPQNIPDPLVHGLSNEELWTLVRRFNKQMYHVKAIPVTEEGPLNGLDLNIADEEEFSSDKLRSNIERMYMTIGLGMVSLLKHIARLRSWKETRRTALFCSVYFLAWLLDFIIPITSLLLMLLITYPPSRSFLFPPTPISLTSPVSTQSPLNSESQTDDSLTGAPQNYHGEAVEQEASNLVTGFAAIGSSIAFGKHPEHHSIEGASASSGGEEGVFEKTIPDPTNVATDLAGGREGGADDVKDQTKRPMEIVMWDSTRPAMHALADLADGWERFANALSPTAPFHANRHRLRLAAALVLPLFLVSCFVTTYMVYKVVMFGIGVGFFGDPIIAPLVAKLNAWDPLWYKRIELRSTLLSGVPTNAQLTLTLLRVGEKNNAPIPPPPVSSAVPTARPAEAPEEPPALKDQDITSQATASDADIPPKHTKKGSKVLSFLRGTVRTGANAVLGTDKVKAKVGSVGAKNRLGILPHRKGDPDAKYSGPVEFDGRYIGKKGTVKLDFTDDVSVISFISKSLTDSTEPQWKIAIEDIRGLRKLGGLGWKGRLIVGWAMDKEVKDALEIECSSGMFIVTALKLREELFNRLVSIGEQRWESW